MMPLRLNLGGVKSLAGNGEGGVTHTGKDFAQKGNWRKEGVYKQYNSSVVMS